MMEEKEKIVALEQVAAGFAGILVQYPATLQAARITMENVGGDAKRIGNLMLDAASPKPR